MRSGSKKRGAGGASRDPVHREAGFRRWIGALAAFAMVLAAFGLAACGGSSDDGGDGNAAEDGGSGTTGELPIALNVPTTGAGAPFGLPAKCAWTVVADEHNEAGGLTVGDGTYNLKLIVDDNKWDPAVTRSAIEKEVSQDKVKIVKTIGDPGDPIIVPITEPAKVLLVDSTGNKQFMEEPYNYVVGSWPSPNLMGTAFFEAVLENEPDIKSAYHVAFDLQFDRNNAKWAREAIEGLGIDWKGDVFYQAGTVDFSSTLAPAVRANPDLIVLGSVGADAPAIVRTLRQLGFEGVIASDAVSQSLEDVVKGAGEKAADGFYQAEVFTRPINQAVKDYEKQYRAACNGDWDATQGILFWTEASFVMQAIQNAGTTEDTDAILEAMLETEIESPFNEGNPRVVLGGESLYGRPRELTTPIALNQFADGDYTTVKVLDYSQDD